MPSSELENQPSIEPKKQEVWPIESNEAKGDDAMSREQLEGELQQVESDIKKAEKERDNLREEFRKANDAEYSARLNMQRELSVNPQSVDLGLLKDAQRANKAITEMYQRKLDEWGDQGSAKYYRLQQEKQKIQDKLKELGA